MRNDATPFKMTTVHAPTSMTLRISNGDDRLALRGYTYDAATSEWVRVYQAADGNKDPAEELLWAINAGMRPGPSGGGLITRERVLKMLAA